MDVGGNSKKENIMQISEYVIQNLAKAVCGDSGYTPYLSGLNLVQLFNKYGFNNVYGKDFPSRWKYTEDCIRELNGKPQLKALIEETSDPRRFHSYGKSIEDAVEIMNDFFKYDGYELKKVGLFYKVEASLQSQVEENEVKTSDVYFNNIHELLKEELTNAKYLIWVAVAWFTNKELYDLLAQKTKDGLNVQVLIIDDETNTNSNLSFGKDFYVQKIQKKGTYQNIMHHKYCIIDLNRVIHGTYNWTNKANFNNETIDVENGRENAEKFADEFIKLKLENRKL